MRVGHYDDMGVTEWDKVGSTGLDIALARVLSFVIQPREASHMKLWVCNVMICSHAEKPDMANLEP